MLDRVSNDGQMQLITDILTNIKECLIILDENYKIYYWNQGTCIFGYEDYEVIGKSIFTIFNWPELPAILNNPELEQQELIKKIKTSKGFRSYRINFNKIMHLPTQTYYIALTLSDISKLVEAETREKNANLAKSEFLANLSHEIRTPLVGILGFCELLTKANLGVEELEYVETIEFCTHQLMGIVNKVLDLSKIEAGQIEINSKPFNIRQMVKKTISAMQPNIDKKGLNCIEDIDHNVPPYLIGDEVKIQQILTNLVANAIKYTENGYIKVGLSLDSYNLNNSNLVKIKISVYDTGNGIETHKASEIFNPFVQLNRSSEYNGVGLGLAISKKLIEVMGGNIWYEPNGERGSIFSFSITLAKVDEEIKEPNISYDLKPIKNDIRVLLVEDVAISRKLISLMLKGMGYEVIEAANGEECLKKLNYSSPDIILMDMQMPILDGFATTKLIRKNRQYEDIPIIALTAYAMTSDITKCIEVGCNHYLSKPFTREQLVQLLDSCLV